MAEKNEIKDIVDELAKLRIAVGGLNPDPTKTIDAQQAETQASLAATKNLAASTARLMWATWALVGITIVLALAALGPVVAVFRGHPDDWVLYQDATSYGVVGAFKTLEACRVAEKRAPYSRGCFPRGVSPK